MRSRPPFASRSVQVLGRASLGLIVTVGVWGGDPSRVVAAPPGATQPPGDSQPSTSASPREIGGPRSELSVRDRRRLEVDERRRRRASWLTDRRALPSLRVGVGPIAPLAPARPATAAFDLDAGLWVVPRPRARASLTLRPAFGYALVADRTAPRHAVTLGLGVGVGSPLVTVSWVPTLLAGAADRAPMVGARHGIEVALGYGVVSVQARHDIVPTDGRVEQAVGVVFGFDFVAIAWLASAASQ